MANVSFNEEPVSNTTYTPVKESVFIRTVLATGIVRTSKQAEYVLVGVVVLAIILTFVLWPKGRPAPELDVNPVAGPSAVVR